MLLFFLAGNPSCVFLLMVQAQKRQETPYGCFHPHPNVDGAVHHVGRRADDGVPPAEAENSILDWHNWTWATSLMTKSTSAFSSPSPLCLAKSCFSSRNQSLWNPTFQHSMDVSTVLTASTCMHFSSGAWTCVKILAPPLHAAPPQSKRHEEHYWKHRDGKQHRCHIFDCPAKMPIGSWLQNWHKKNPPHLCWVE